MYILFQEIQVKNYCLHNKQFHIVITITYSLRCIIDNLTHFHFYIRMKCKEFVIILHSNCNHMVCYTDKFTLLDQVRLRTEVGLLHIPSLTRTHDIQIMTVHFMSLRHLLYEIDKLTHFWNVVSWLLVYFLTMSEIDKIFKVEIVGFLQIYSSLLFHIRMKCEEFIKHVIILHNNCNHLWYVRWTNWLVTVACNNYV